MLEILIIMLATVAAMAVGRLIDHAQTRRADSHRADYLARTGDAPWNC